MQKYNLVSSEGFSSWWSRALRSRRILLSDISVNCGSRIKTLRAGVRWRERLITPATDVHGKRRDGSVSDWQRMDDRGLTQSRIE
jgi:hypothetical protein